MNSKLKSIFGKTRILFNKKNDLMFLKFSSEHPLTTAEAEDFKWELEFYYLNSKELIEDFFLTSKEYQDNYGPKIFKKDAHFDSNQDKTGVYIYYSNGIPYIGEGRYYHRYYDHTRGSFPRLENIDKVFIITKKQKQENWDKKYTKYIEWALIDEVGLANTHNKECVKQTLNPNAEVYCKKLVEEAKRTFKFFNLDLIDWKSINKSKRTKNEDFSQNNKENLTISNNNFSVEIQQPKNKIKDLSTINEWLENFFRVNNKITLSLKTKGKSVEIFIEHFENNTNNTFVVKKGSFIFPESKTANKETKNWRKQFLPKEEGILEQDLIINNTKITNIVRAFNGSYWADGDLKIKETNHWIYKYFEEFKENK